jgi:hypothetical protein
MSSIEMSDQIREPFRHISAQKFPFLHIMLHLFMFLVNLCFNINYFMMAAHHIFEKQPNVFMKNWTIFSPNFILTNYCLGTKARLNTFS